MKMLRFFVDLLFGTPSPRIQMLRTSIFGGFVTSLIYSALIDTLKNLWVYIGVTILSILMVCVIFKLFMWTVGHFNEVRQKRILKIWCMGENIVLASVIILFFTWIHLRNVSYDLYYEMVEDCYGMLNGVGESDCKCHAGWYRFRYKGIHSEDDTSKHRYAPNCRKEVKVLGKYYRTLHRVEMVDGEGRTLPNYIDQSLMYTAYKYREDGLDVEFRGAFQFEGFPSDDLPLLVVQKWVDIGENINAKCDMRDGGNNSFFAPGSSTSSTLPSLSFIPQSKFSSYKVSRDAKGRPIATYYAVPDHDGINQIDYEYADNDEYNFSYLKKITFNTVNKDGIRETTYDYNGHSVERVGTGIITIKTTMATLTRNELLWTNLVQITSEPSPYPALYGAKKLRSSRVLDVKGRITQEELFRLDGKKEELVETKSYSWSDIGKTGLAIKSITYRDGERKLKETPFYQLASLFQDSTTNMLLAAKVEYNRTNQFNDAVMFDKTGTNVICRLRFCNYGKDRERIEFRSNDGLKLVSANRYIGENVVAYEERTFDIKDAPFVKNNERLVCYESKWLNRKKESVVCFAGWATRRVYRNNDYIDDVEDQRFSGLVRRLEYLDTDGQICKNLMFPYMSPVREFDYDRNGRVVEIRALSDENSLMDCYSFDGDVNSFVPAVFTIAYDQMGRVSRWAAFNRERKPVDNSEIVLMYEGTSRSPCKILRVNKDGTHTDVTSRMKDMDVFMNPDLLGDKLLCGRFGVEVK